MLHDVDTALRSLLAGSLPTGTGVRFDAPEPAWRTVGGETVGAFLYRVSEDMSARAASWSDERDEHGRVTGRRLAQRRYQVSYLLTAWAPGVEREHELLGAALTALSAADSVAEEHLPLSLLESPVALRVASPEFASAPMDLWSALGIPPRACLDVVITAPLATGTATDLAPAPDTIDLGVAATPGREPEPDRPSLPPPRGRITEQPAR